MRRGHTVPLPVEFDRFDRQATYLAELPFTMKVSERNASFLFSPGSDGYTTVEASDVPPRDELIALAATLRMFTLDGDRVSFKHMEGLYDGLPVSDRLKQEVRELRAELNAYLDAPSVLHNVSEGHHLTNRELLQMVIYGDMLHMQAPKDAWWRDWTVGGFEPLIHHFFAMAALPVLQAVFNLRAINRRAVQVLSVTAA